MARLILFTDLDGTLLDHQTYSYEPALPVLARLKKMAVPVVLASSKTGAEIAALQQEMGLAQWPAIVENGAGVLWPGTGKDETTGDYPGLLAAIDRIDPVLRQKFSGFAGWSVAEIAERTGLDEVAAERARRRRFSEPGIFSGGDAEYRAFLAALEGQGLTATTGGRFLTISRGASKAGRLKEIVDRLFGEPAGVTTVALGDAPNDIELLEAADIGFIIANPGHDPLPELAGEREGRIRRTELAGPAGWAAAVETVLPACD